MSLEEKIVKAVIPNWQDDMPLPTFVEEIKDAFKSEGYTKRHQILEGIKR